MYTKIGACLPLRVSWRAEGRRLSFLRWRLRLRAVPYRVFALLAHFAGMTGEDAGTGLTLTHSERQATRHEGRRGVTGRGGQTDGRWQATRWLYHHKPHISTRKTTCRLAPFSWRVKRQACSLEETG